MKGLLTEDWRPGQNLSQWQQYLALRIGICIKTKSRLRLVVKGKEKMAVGIKAQFKKKKKRAEKRRKKKKENK